MTDAFAPSLDEPNALYPAAPPSEAELLGKLGEARRQALVDLPAKVVDPTISPKDRILTGAAVHSGKVGSDREAYAAWRSDRSVGVMPQTPARPGISERQARFLATPDDRVAQAKSLGAAGDTKAANVAGWLATYEQNNSPAAPVDVARFDRVVDDKVLAPGRAKDLYSKLLAGNLNDEGEAAELASTVGKVARALDPFDDDLSLGRNGKLVSVDTEPDVRLRIHYTKDNHDEPVSAPGALQALPGDWLPAAALAGSVGSDGFDLYVGESDAVVIGAADAVVDAAVRKGFPAAIGHDGTPRWMSVRPVLVTSIDSVKQAAERVPNSVVETHLSAYPGFLPYDSIVFETDRAPKRLQELGAVRLGRGISTGPKLSMRRLSESDLIDAHATQDFIQDAAWALFPGDHPDGIPVSGPDGSTGKLVFGVTPEEAAAAAPYAFVNDGIATAGDDYDDIVDGLGDDDDIWHISAADGTDVSFAVDFEESPMIVERANRPVDRWHLPLDDRTRPLVKGLADNIELTGATNVVVYASVPEIEGFQRVREHVYGDGGSGYTVARTADPLLGDPNGLPIFVRHADALPANWVSVPVDALDTKVEELTAQRKGDRWIVDARGLDDIGSQVRSAHALAGKYGYGAVELLGDDGPIKLAEVKRD